MNTLAKIDKIRDQIGSIKPYQEVLADFKDYFKIINAYSTNAIEGNILTEGETKVVIEDGLTISGKPLKDHLEAIGYSDAFDFVYEIKDYECLTEEQILKLHNLFFHRIDTINAGIYRDKPGFVAEFNYVPAVRDQMPQVMKDFFVRLNEFATKEHPVNVSIFAHRELLLIQPFIDGNGVIARLLMNLELLRNGYYPAFIPPSLKDEYSAALKLAAKKQQNETFDQFMLDRIVDSMEELKKLVGKL